MHLFTGDRDQLEGYDSENELKLSSSVSVWRWGGAFGCITLCPTKTVFISLKKSQGSGKLPKSQPVLWLLASN